MSYKKLAEKELFSKLRIEQLFDDIRIEAAHYAMIKRGKTIMQNEKMKSKQDAIERYAKIRGLLFALGYPLRLSDQRRTNALRELLRKSWPRIIFWYKFYKGRVKRSKS